MSRYSLVDFNKILEDGIINQISDETVTIINMLAAQVGAPEYIKTPQFKTKSNIGCSNNTNISGRRRKKVQEINDDDWEAMRSFQTTEFEKKEGVEYNLFMIRKYLNMVTTGTVSKLKDDIMEEINTVISTKTESDLNYLCNEIFTIISCNILYSDTYAKLYKDLITDINKFNEILFTNFDRFEDHFNNIEYYDPEVDYNKFCENNKKNEALRSLTTFYVNLMKEGIIDKMEIASIILHLFAILDKMITDQKKMN